MKRRLIIAALTILLIAGFGTLLHKMSFDPDFSIFDAITGATKDDDEEAEAYADALEVSL